LDATATETSSSISRGLELGFNRLVDNIPDPADVTYDGIMHTMTDEIVGSDTLVTYLIVTNTINDHARITLLHSIGRYSARFGGSNALHGATLGLLGEMVDSHLPTLVRFSEDPLSDLAYGLRLESVNVPSDTQVDAYFAQTMATNLMPRPQVAQGAVLTNLATLCPIPLSWAPYFMDFKTPQGALGMGRQLVATLTSADDRAKADPILDWLRGTWVRRGAAQADRLHSILDQELESTAPDTRAIRWMKARVSLYQKHPPLAPPTGPTGVGGAPVLPPSSLAPRAGEKEYSQLEPSKIQAACGLTGAQWATDLPELYTRMLEEGHTTAQVKALLEDIFWPDNIYSLSLVHTIVTDEMAKDIKEINFGYNNDLSYNTYHRGILPFTVIGLDGDGQPKATAGRSIYSDLEPRTSRW
jgi:hypothetical protein